MLREWLFTQWTFLVLTPFSVIFQLYYFGRIFWLSGKLIDLSPFIGSVLNSMNLTLVLFKGIMLVHMTFTTCKQVVEYNTGTMHECYISKHDLNYV